MSELAQSLVTAINLASRATKTDEELAEVLVRPFLVAFVEVLGRRGVTKLLEEVHAARWGESEPSPTIPAPPPEPSPPAPAAKEPSPWCYRVVSCGRRADVEVFDETTGTYKPACRSHAAGRGELEMRRLQQGPNA